MKGLFEGWRRHLREGETTKWIRSGPMLDKASEKNIIGGREAQQSGVNIIDFDSASTNRKMSNLTSCVQYLFIGGPYSKLFENLFEIDIDKVIFLLRKYKSKKDYLTFYHLLHFLNMN